MSVEITVRSDMIIAISPYHPDLPAAARAIGGKWYGGSKAWGFDPRDEARVRDLYRRVYGTDGTPGQTLTVRMDVDKAGLDYQSEYFCGRRIVHRAGRDRSVQLGDGVVVVEGGFPASGGSVKNPALEPERGTVLEIRDVPAGHEDLTRDGVTVVDQAVDVDALTAERERLLARVAEIDAMLPEPEGVEATTRQAAAVLGVSVRTVQRWAATGRVEARKDTAGHWIITVTTGR